MRTTMIAALCIMVLAACTNTEPIEPDGPTSQTAAQSTGLPTGTYELVTLNGDPVIEDSTITLTLTEQGIEGSTGCNNYAGSIEQVVEGPLFGPIETTEEFCDGLMEQEAEFLRALTVVDTLSREGTTLTMTGQDRELMWEARTPDYTGDYELLTLNGQTPPATITLTLTEESIGGNAGCNDYGGTITTLTANSIAFDMLAATEMACARPEGVMEVEADFLAALNKVTTISAGEADLILTGPDDITLRWARTGAAEGRSAPAFADSLVGTEWELSAFREDSDVPAATLTVNEGELMGSTGCNSYFADFTIVEGNNVEVGGVGATKMACDEPEGIMAFEQTFLEALPTVTTLEPVDEFAFNMRNAEGQVVFTWREAIEEVTPTLEGTEWVLTTIMDGNAASSTLADTTLTILFEEGTISGDAGCNTFNGSYTLEGDELTINEDIATTRMACEDDIMQQEATYLESLGAFSRYTLEEGTLTLTANNGLDLVFRPAN